MSLDSDFLRSIRRRYMFKDRLQVTKLYLFEEQTRFIIGMMSRYFKQFPDCQEIDKDTFLTWLEELKGDGIKDTDVVLIAKLLEDFNLPLTNEGELFLTDRLRDANVAYQTADILEKYTNGDEIEITEALNGVIVAANKTRRTDLDTEVTAGILDILENENADHGFRWPYKSMNRAMRCAQPGDMIIVAARPETGKTTFLATLAKCFNTQVEELHGDRPILWLNNEGPGSRIKVRLYQAALGVTLTEMAQLADQGLLEEQFEAAMGKMNIRIYDIHGWNTGKVERLIERLNPCVVIWDMLDKVKYSSEDLSRNNRTDEYLEGLYTLVRDSGVIYDCVNIVASQLSGDAENQQYPMLANLMNSRTGKQGTADAIVTLGYVSTMPNTRYLGLTKNKLRRESSGNRLGELQMDGARGLLTEPEAE